MTKRKNLTKKRKLIDQKLVADKHGKLVQVIYVRKKNGYEQQICLDAVKQNDNLSSVEVQNRKSRKRILIKVKLKIFSLRLDMKRKMV